MSRPVHFQAKVGQSSYCHPNVILNHVGGNYSSTTNNFSTIAIKCQDKKNCTTRNNVIIFQPS